MKDLSIAKFNYKNEIVGNYTIAFQIETYENKCRIIAELLHNERGGFHTRIKGIFQNYFPIEEKEKQIEEIRELLKLEMK